MKRKRKTKRNEVKNERMSENNDRWEGKPHNSSYRRSTEKKEGPGETEIER